MKKSVVVIGAGVGGLAVAIKLAKAGFDVEVFEQSEVAGGKMGQFVKDGFRFDTGPSLFTLPQLVRQLIEKQGGAGVGFEFQKLENLCRYHYSDGVVLNAYGDI